MDVAVDLRFRAEQLWGTAVVARERSSEVAQKAGDLNAIAVGWNGSTAAVSSVTDSSGNTYQRAVGLTIVAGTLFQSIYFARNIPAAAAGVNTVPVQFSTGGGVEILCLHVCNVGGRRGLVLVTSH